MNENSIPIRRRDAIEKLVGGMAALSTLSVSGCTRILLGSGKILFGDPKIQAEFTKLTNEDLTNGKKTVLVVCSTPESVEDDVSTLKLDIIDGVTRRLTLNRVKTIHPDRVTEWIDEHDSIFNERQLNEVAKDFDTEYIVWIDVHDFRLQEPNSQKLLRGHTSGYIRVYKVKEEFDQKVAQRRYQTEFSLNYPEHQAVSAEGRSLSVFHKDYVNHLCDLLAERFYDHRRGSHF